MCQGGCQLLEVEQCATQRGSSGGGYGSEGTDIKQITQVLRQTVARTLKAGNKGVWSGMSCLFLPRGDNLRKAEGHLEPQQPHSTIPQSRASPWDVGLCSQHCANPTAQQWPPLFWAPFLRNPTMVDPWELVPGSRSQSPGSAGIPGSRSLVVGPSLQAQMGDRNWRGSVPPGAQAERAGQTGAGGSTGGSSAGGQEGGGQCPEGSLPRGGFLLQPASRAATRKLGLAASGRALGWRRGPDTLGRQPGALSSHPEPRCGCLVGGALCHTQ